MSDKTIVCRDCDQPFTFTAGEQAFYQERGFNEPQRCAECRAARKTQRSTDSFGGSSYGSSSYGNGGGSRGSYGSSTRQMYPAVCSQCGVQTEVPFQPRNDKPVYCRECFRDKRPAASSYGSRY